MTRVLLINPPSPEQMGSPLLGLQYVAAALLAKGCEVRVIDAAARYFEGDAASIIGQARAFSPDLIGLSLFTRWVWHAYGLSARLAGTCRLLVAGGAHATVRAEETLDRGFDVAVSGEAELDYAGAGRLSRGTQGSRIDPRHSLSHAGWRSRRRSAGPCQ